MNKMRMLFAISVVFVALLSGCGASRTVPIPDFGALDGFIGKNSEEMTAKFGEPDRRYSGEKNTLVAEYRWAAQKKKMENAMMVFGTFGVSSGSDSAYVDILRCWFRNNVVLVCTKVEDMMNANLPGMGESSNQAPPSIPNESKQQLQVAERKQTRVAVESPAPAIKTNSKKSAVASTTEPAEKMPGSKTFKNKKVKTVKANILAGTEISGMKVVNKKDNNITLMTPEGIVIEITIKQIKNDTIVKIIAKENPNRDADISKILASCK